MKYVKYISQYEVEEAPVCKDGIINFNQNVELMNRYGYFPLVKAVRPEDRLYVVTYSDKGTSVEEVVVAESDEQKAARIRRELDDLTLTPADVWRAIYKDKRITQATLLEMIQEEMSGVDIEAVKIEFGASTYYRGAKLGNNKIFDVIGTMLGYTEADLDYLFQNKVFPPSITEDDE